MTGAITDLVLAPATGKALPIRRGQLLRVEQVADGQCVDLNVFNLHDRHERFDAARTRLIHGTRPSVGAVLWSTPPADRPLLTVAADTVGENDLLFPACTELEYRALAGSPSHTNCRDILAEAGREYGIRPEELHDPFNAWLDAGVAADGTLHSRPVSARAGDYIEFLAHLDVLVLVSLCGDDLFGSSQYELKPVRVRVSEAPAEVTEAHLRASQAAGVESGRALEPALSFAPAWRPARVQPREIELRLPRELRGTIEALTRSGRFGRTEGETVRAVFFRWWQETQLQPWEERNVRAS